MSKQKKHVHVLVDENTIQTLDSIAESNGITRSFIINVVLKDFVKGLSAQGKGISNSFLKGLSVVHYFGD